MVALTRSVRRAFTTRPSATRNTVREDCVTQRNSSSGRRIKTCWASWFRTVAGVRGDADDFTVDANLPYKFRQGQRPDGDAEASDDFRAVAEDGVLSQLRSGLFTRTMRAVRRSGSIRPTCATLGDPVRPLVRTTWVTRAACAASRRLDGRRPSRCGVCNRILTCYSSAARGNDRGVVLRLAATAWNGSNLHPGDRLAGIRCRPGLVTRAIQGQRSGGQYIPGAVRRLPTSASRSTSSDPVRRPALNYFGPSAAGSRILEAFRHPRR